MRRCTMARSRLGEFSFLATLALATFCEVSCAPEEGRTLAANVDQDAAAPSDLTLRTTAHATNRLQQLRDRFRMVQVDLANVPETPGLDPTAAPTKSIRPVIADGLAERLDAAEGDSIRPVFPADAIANTPKPARLLLPASAGGWTTLQDESSTMSIRFTLREAADVPAQASGGLLLYPGALHGADVLQRPMVHGTEDYVVFEEAPTEQQVEYDVNVEGVPGVRLVENVVEFLDRDGAPRLRVANPYVVDASGQRREASVRLSHCAFDTSAKESVGRPVTPPGSDVCTVTIGWGDQALRYPLVLDPAWTTTGFMIDSRSQHKACALSGARVLVAGGLGPDGTLATAEVFYYDAGRIWGKVGSMDVKRIGHVMTCEHVLDGRKIYVHGGRDGSTVHASLQEYWSGDWGTHTSSALARWGHAGFVRTSPSDPASPVLWIFGGFTDATGTATNTIWRRTSPIYATSSWAANGTLAQARGNMSASNLLVPNTTYRKIVLAGGAYYSGAAWVRSNVVEGSTLLNETTWATYPYTLSVARSEAAVGVASDAGNVSYMVVAGGFAAAGRSTAVDVLTPTARTSPAGMQLPVATTNATLSWETAPAGFEWGGTLSNPSKLLLLGGYTTAGVNTARLLDLTPGPNSAAWVSISDLPEARYNHVALPLSEVHKTLVVGGYLTGATTSGHTNSALLYGRPNSDRCDFADDCQSGFCVDGLCCDTACAGVCSSCLASKKGGGIDGVCGLVGAGTDPDGDCVASPSTTCGFTGACTSAGACELWPATTLCEAHHCVGNTLTHKECDGAGSCDLKQSACGSYVCQAGPLCPSTCTGDAHCVSGYYCLGGTCTPKKAGASQTCTELRECASGYCADGFCCNESCAGSCRACAATSTGLANGTCGFAIATKDPHNDCPDEGSTSCGRNGACAGGSSSCAYYDGNTVCSPNNCNTSGQVVPWRCDIGTHACKAGTATSCANNLACSDGACLTQCGDDSHCATGSFCNVSTHQCTAKKTGTNQACPTGAHECASDSCVDGFCCDQTCTTACWGCAAALTGKANGVCSAVTAGVAAPHGECADGGPSFCGQNGKCDGSGSCAKYDASTPCGQDYCDANVAKQRRCNGTGACDSTSGTSCLSYACMPGGVCPTLCTADNHCATGNFCAQSVCKSKYDNGASCQSANQCESGYCTDGVCCNQACTGLCRACLAALKGGGADGDCGSIPSGFDPDAECDIDPANDCGGDGTCDGAGACKVTAKTTPCGGGGTVCENNTVTGQFCDGLGFCTADSGGTPCAPHLCQGNTCGTTCVSDTQCVGDAYCDANNHCVPKGDNGGDCTSPNTCKTGYCVDGICCDSPCDGTCQSCRAADKTVGLDGECGTVRTGLDPRNDCNAASPSTCQADGTCDGAGNCKLFANTTSCGTTICDGNRVKGLTCDGLGVCRPNVDGTDCSPFLCAADGCTTVCASDSQCADGAYCSAAGVCEPTVAPGESCTSGKACLSGFCSDGVCCNAACDAQCEACDVAGSLGVCVPVTGAPHGDRDPCSGGSSTCSGTCDGSDPTSCGYPGAAVACGGACTDGLASRSACSGDGKCVAGGIKSCAPFACDVSDCRTSCSADTDCAAGYTCDTAKKTCLPQGGGECDGEHTVSVPGTTVMVDCSPYKCGTETGRCGTSCASDGECVAGNTCEVASKTCVQAPASVVTQQVESGGCGCRSAGGTSPARGVWTLLAVSCALALGRKRRR